MDILIVKTSSLGDLIHMLPAVTDACQAYDSLQIDWLAEESFAPIPAWHPAVSQVIPVAMRRWKKNWRARHTWQEIRAVRARLQTRSYDLIIDSQGLMKSALWTLLAPGPSAGYDRHSIREPLASKLYTRNLRVSRQLHAIERNRQLMALALGYALPQSSPDYGLQGLCDRLPRPEVEIPPHSVIGLHGTSRADKLWPTQGWISLAQTLASVQRTLLLPWGNQEELERARHICQQCSNAKVLPQLQLNALASCIGEAEAVIGVDTGLLHLAAALGKPGLALYTVTQPALTGAVSDCHASIALQNLSAPAELEPLAVSSAIIDILNRLTGPLS